MQPAETSVAAPATEPDDRRLVDALRAGDEQEFARLVREYGPTMLRVASLYVRSRSVAEEVVQEAWLGALKGLDRFEGRSSFKTWLFRILTNTAKTRAQQEGRSVPFSSLADGELGAEERSVDEAHFLPGGDRWAGHWSSSPLRFDALPEGRLLGAESMEVARGAIEALPHAQQAVITMRDVVGLSSEDVCVALGITEGNQRVLLHRARTKVRRTLEVYLEGSEPV